jgi:two-component system phosphate regulon response regulator PhoB
MVRHRTVVVVEDEADIQEVIEYNLRREGFRVICAQDGESGLRRAREESPDLVLLDLMLPDVDGVEVCRLLKENPLTRTIPVIMVTAKGEESDVILGLGLGADDYITKPFSPREVVARVKAVLRRGALREEGAAAERLQRDGLVVDVGRHTVRIDDEPVSFTATELRLLHFLASHPGRVFTRDQLLNRVIGERAVVISRNIDVHIRAIRKKLGPYREWIETIRGVGYRFRDVES